MKEFFNTMKKNIIVLSVLYILFGIVIAAFPGIISDVLCYVLAGACILYGITCLFTYFKRDMSMYSPGMEFVAGVLAVAVGIFLCFNAAWVKGMLSLFLSLLVIILGTLRLQQAIDLIRLHDRFWITAMIVSIVVLAFGIVSACSLSAGDIVVRVIGIGLILCGISELLTTYKIEKRINQMRNEASYIEIHQNKDEI